MNILCETPQLVGLLKPGSLVFPWLSSQQTLSSRFWIAKRHDSADLLDYSTLFFSISIQPLCFTGHKRKVNVVSPIMAGLHLQRLAFRCPPFTMNGFHYFGPDYASVKCSRGKCRGVVFTCPIACAVVFEMVTSMDTSGCIMEIGGIVFQHGVPSVL